MINDLRADRISAYLRDIAGEDGVDALRVDEQALEALKRANRAQESVGGMERARPSASAMTVNAALESVASGTPLNREFARGLEAIIIPGKRPVMPLARGTFTATHEKWLHLNNPAVRDMLVKASRSIGRIEVPGSKYPYGGTGFVVAPGLIMTNRHVAEIFVDGVGDRDLVFRSGVSPGFSDSFAPDNDEEPPPSISGIRMLHPYWDMALLEVAGLTSAPLTLSPRDAAFYDKEEIAVIGYPAYDPRNDSDVQLKLFDSRFGVKQLQPGLLRNRRPTESFGKIVEAVTHDCSTLGGNSGSAVIHIASGQVLGLHFGGEYLIRNFAVAAFDLALDGRVVDAGVTFDPKASPAQVPSWSGYWQDSDTQENTPADAAALNPHAAESRPAAVMASGQTAIRIPLHICIRLGEGGAPTIRIEAAPQTGATTERTAEPAQNTNYGSRRGYDAAFLGVKVPFPKPKDPGAVAITRQGGMRLDYQNFSIIMHAKRRLALVTGSNVSAETTLTTPEVARTYTRRALGRIDPSDQERWFADCRLDELFQLPYTLYTKDHGVFDKEHIVRREDVAWGARHADLRRANGDIFHVTNCSPQISVFDQSTGGRENWREIENEVLKQAASERLCVFAGPVLAADDPRFLGNFEQGQRGLIQIPIKFWKVIVARSSAGIAAFGFMLEQSLADGEASKSAMREAFRAYMMPIEAIAALAGVAFDTAITGADQFDGRGPELALKASIGRKRH
ncbi:DNA/RNA non-specific endonuclease [Bosea sp. BK604]|uniref:DNA/RNA non-specific endonuclease n=1 Tax=Bosea sp. BK604 TaxID=2512180 RepID=UPI001047085C|nr:DNA/RNA non-specific endonuclease [Bosea sp. BK604]TCR60560.1 endonuclease G [Bosea sp. BK604]